MNLNKELTFKIWLLFTALHPHAHSSPRQGFSLAPGGAKTAYVGGVPASQTRYGFTYRLFHASMANLYVNPYRLWIVTKFESIFYFISYKDLTVIVKNSKI